jgi:UDP-glucose 4-epimerase
MKRVLVTGAGGFIGKHTCTLLAERGHKVFPVLRVADDLANLKEGFSEAFLADLSKSAVPDEASRVKSEVVVHLAAALPKSGDAGEMKRVAEINKWIDQNILHWCQEQGVGAIYASGASVYGLGNGDVKVESSPCNPVGEYVAEKLFGEEMGAKLLESRGLQFAALRISAPFGPHQRARTVLNIFVERAIQGVPLLYHGSGNRQQDFTYVKDVAEAFSLAVERGVSGIFNICSGRPVSMKQLAKLVIRVAPDCKSSAEPSGQVDPQEGTKALFSIEKARDELAWTPRTPLDLGIRRCVRSKLVEEK